MYTTLQRLRWVTFTSLPVLFWANCSDALSSPQEQSTSSSSSSSSSAAAPVKPKGPPPTGVDTPAPSESKSGTVIYAATPVRGSGPGTSSPVSAAPSAIYATPVPKGSRPSSEHFTALGEAQLPSPAASASSSSSSLGLAKVQASHLDSEPTCGWFFCFLFFVFFVLS